MISALLIHFYKFWHGRLHLKGAGLLLLWARSILPGLSFIKLRLQEGHILELDFHDVSAMYWLNHTLGDRFEEEGLLTAVLSEIREGSVVWDVGANCGLFSYRLAQNTKAKQIIFFEPNQAMFQLAKTATTPHSKVQGFPYALSDQSGFGTLVVPHGGSTTATMEADRTNRSGISTQIECRRGDELVETGLLKAPHIIKIDTEGHEIAVISGLKNIITRHRPIIFFEHISLSDSEVLRLTPQQYTIYSVSDRDGSLSEGFCRHRGHNSALVPKETFTQESTGKKTEQCEL